MRSLYSQEGPPPKLNLGSAINALKAQNHCAGVYVLQKQPGKPEGEANKQPLYKHCSEDLQICAGTVKGEPGWVVCKFSTASSGRQQVCMRLSGASLPYERGNQGKWQEWDGRDWIPAPSVNCKPSWHGWGLDKLDRTRLKFSPNSRSGAF